MQLFLVAFQQPIPFGIFVAVVILMIGIIAQGRALDRGRRRAGSRAITNPNAKFLFTFLFIVWAVGFGIGLQLVPARRRQLAVRRARADRPVHRASSS